MSNKPQPKGAIRVFYSYSHKDKELRDTLETHLALLKRRRVISGWHDRLITAGEEWAGQIDRRLMTADIILLLISANFLASKYCYDVEMKIAMRRHRAGEARVIPVILRPCDMTGAAFRKLQALPTGGRPVTTWKNKDEAFLDIANGIRLVAEEVRAKRGAATTATAAPDDDSVENVPACAESKTVSPLIPRPPVVGFVARRDKDGRDIVGLLREELAPDKNHLVALWGPGGAGKTTIAAEVVRATEAVFKGRIVWASPLRRADFSSATLLDEMATQLGREDLRRLAPEPKAAQVAALVSEAPTLVILDNFETVAGEEQTRSLDFLAQSAACPVLITTRYVINRDEVYNVPLAAMEMDEARDFLGRLVARIRKPSNFDNLDRDALIIRCEANPLVLQWVVRQVDLAKRPQDVFDDLERGEGDAAERVFTRSFNLTQLGDDGRLTLLALSLFTPSASREALAKVAGFGNDLRRLNKALESLSSLWLAETTEGNERLFLRGLTRELAKSRLLNDARVLQFQRRYVNHYLAYSEAYPDPVPEDFDALELEKDNLLGAMDVASQTRDWNSVMRIRTSLNEFIYLRGYLNEAVRSGELAAAAAREMKDDSAIAFFQMCIAIVVQYRGEYEEAKKMYREALRGLKSGEDDRNIAACLHQLGVIAKGQGNLEEAQKLGNESLEKKRNLGNQSGITSTLQLLGNIAYILNDVEEARRLYGESLEIGRAAGEQYTVSTALTNLGVIEHNEENSEEARRLYSEGLEIAKRLGDQDSIAAIKHNLGMLAAKEGDTAEASRLFREALHIFEKLGSPSMKQTREQLADIDGESA